MAEPFDRIIITSYADRDEAEFISSNVDGSVTIELRDYIDAMVALRMLNMACLPARQAAHDAAQEAK